MDKMRQCLLLLPVFLIGMTVQAQQFRLEFGNARKPFVETVAVPNHPDSYYRLGQQAQLTVTAREGGVPVSGTTIYYKAGPEMLLPEAPDSTTFADGQAVLPMGTMTEPGFLACQYEWRSKDGKVHKDLVKVAYEPEAIRTYTEMPADFRQFWQQAVADARKVDLEPEYTDIPDATNDQFVTRLVRLHVGKDKWIRGYLTMPLTSPSGSGFPVVLCPPGAGSQKIYPSDYFPAHGCIYLKIEIHDNDQLLSDEAYNAMRQKKCNGYVGRGMASRDTYYYKDVYVGCVRALDFLCSLPQWDGMNAIVTGGSQGGALTIVTAALHEKVTACAPFYPALCDLTAFLHHRAGGWPKFFTQWSDDSKITVAADQAVETLRYFDVVNFARLLKVPTFMSWGYNDDTCSPTSVWAAWNEIKAPKDLDITPSSGHWRFPASQEKCWEWMQRQLKSQRGDSAFFNSAEALRIGDQLLLYQRDTGGWPKNIDMTAALTPAGCDSVRLQKSRRDDSTIDNDATTTQMHYLARLYRHTREQRFRHAFHKAMQFILSGQYPNGGWPQFWPENRGYQAHITYNDDAMVHVLSLLRDVAERKAPYDGDLVDDSTRQVAATAFHRGIDCILATQIVVDGQPTVWCQQHDRTTLLPTGARSYELPSFCTQESAAIVQLLMQIPHPDERIVRSVHGAMKWLDDHKITGYRIERYEVGGRPDIRLVTDQDAQPLWARYYDLEKGEPFFCDRDGVPRRSLEEIGYERRNGYAWYNEQPATLYDRYATWMTVVCGQK